MSVASVRQNNKRPEACEIAEIVYNAMKLTPQASTRETSAGIRHYIV